MPRILVFVFLLSPFPAVAVPGLSNGTGDDQTLAALYVLRQFEGLAPDQFATRLWFDPYSGSDRTGSGSYDNPFRSFAEMKKRCISYTRCTVKGTNRVFSPLTLTMDGAGHYVWGEGLTWTGSTGMALAWDDPTRTLVVARLSGSDPVLTTRMVGAASGAHDAVVTRSDTLGGIPSLTISGFSDEDDRLRLSNHPYVNGQGPIRLFAIGTLPLGLATRTDYYVCSVAEDGFQLSLSPTCAPIATFAGAGSGAAMVTGYSNTQVHASITPRCADRDRICILFESESPDARVRIDGNGYYPAGLTYTVAPEFWPGDFLTHYIVPNGGIFIVTGDGAEGWVGVQNFDVQNVALDAFSVGNYVVGKLVTLNSRAIDIRNGFSDRSTGFEAAGHNSCFMSTGDGGTTGSGGILYAINAGGSRNDSGNALGSGACINVHRESAMRLIGMGSFTVNGIADDVNCNGHPCSSPVIVMPSGDLVIIGHDLLASRITRSIVMSSHASSVSAPRSRHQWARVVAHLRNPEDAYATVIGVSVDGVPLTQILREVTARSESSNRSTFLAMCSLWNGGTAEFSYKGVLVDDIDFWIGASNCGWATDSDSNFYQTVMDWEGIYDDDDAINGSEEWYEGIRYYDTLDAFRTGVASILASHGAPTTDWKLFETGSHDSGGIGVDGHQLVAGRYRCQTGAECWYGYSTPYTIDLTTVYGARPEDACLPADVLGERVCSFLLTPTHIGANRSCGLGFEVVFLAPLLAWLARRRRGVASVS